MQNIALSSRLRVSDLIIDGDARHIAIIMPTKSASRREISASDGRASGDYRQ